MADQRPFVGDIGTKFDYYITDNGEILNITGATITLYYKKPGTDVLVSKTGVIISAVAGHVRYTGESGFLTVAGTWQVQALVVFDVSNSFRTEIGEFNVKAILA